MIFVQSIDHIGFFKQGAPGLILSEKDVRSLAGDLFDGMGLCFWDKGFSFSWLDLDNREDAWNPHIIIIPRGHFGYRVETQALNSRDLHKLAAVLDDWDRRELLPVLKQWRDLP